MSGSSIPEKPDEGRESGFGQEREPRTWLLDGNFYGRHTTAGKAIAEYDEEASSLTAGDDVVEDSHELIGISLYPWLALGADGYQNRVDEKGV